MELFYALATVGMMIVTPVVLARIAMMD